MDYQQVIKLKAPPKPKYKRQMSHDSKSSLSSSQTLLSSINGMCHHDSHLWDTPREKAHPGPKRNNSMLQEPLDNFLYIPTSSSTTSLSSSCSPKKLKAKAEHVTRLTRENAHNKSRFSRNLTELKCSFHSDSQLSYGGASDNLPGLCHSFSAPVAQHHADRTYSRPEVKDYGLLLNGSKFQMTSRGDKLQDVRRKCEPEVFVFPEARSKEALQAQRELGRFSEGQADEIDGPDSPGSPMDTEEYCYGDISRKPCNKSYTSVGHQQSLTFSGKSIKEHTTFHDPSFFRSSHSEGQVTKPYFRPGTIDSFSASQKPSGWAGSEMLDTSEADEYFSSPDDYESYWDGRMGVISYRRGQTDFNKDSRLTQDSILRTTPEREDIDERPVNTRADTNVCYISLGEADSSMSSDDLEYSHETVSRETGYDHWFLSGSRELCDEIDGKKKHLRLRPQTPPGHDVRIEMADNLVKEQNDVTYPPVSDDGDEEKQSSRSSTVTRPKLGQDENIEEKVVQSSDKGDQFEMVCQDRQPFFEAFSHLPQAHLDRVALDTPTRRGSVQKSKNAESLRAPKHEMTEPFNKMFGASESGRNVEPRKCTRNSSAFIPAEDKSRVRLPEVRQLTGNSQSSSSSFASASQPSSSSFASASQPSSSSFASASQPSSPSLASASQPSSSSLASASQPSSSSLTPASRPSNFPLHRRKREAPTIDVVDFSRLSKSPSSSSDRDSAEDNFLEIRNRTFHRPWEDKFPPHSQKMSGRGDTETHLRMPFSTIACARRPLKQGSPVYANTFPLPSPRSEGHAKLPGENRLFNPRSTDTDHFTKHRFKRKRDNTLCAPSFGQEVVSPLTSSSQISHRSLYLPSGDDHKFAELEDTRREEDTEFLSQKKEVNSAENSWQRESKMRAAHRSPDEVDIRLQVTDLFQEPSRLRQRLDMTSPSQAPACQCSQIERDILKVALEIFQEQHADFSGSGNLEDELQRTNLAIRCALDLADNCRLLCRHGRQVTDVFPGSVIIRMKCPTLTSVVDLCDLHANGDLHRLLFSILWQKETFISTSLTLQVTLNKQSVVTCQKYFLKSLDKPCQKQTGPRKYFKKQVYAMSGQLVDVKSSLAPGFYAAPYQLITTTGDKRSTVTEEDLPFNQTSNCELQHATTAKKNLHRQRASSLGEVTRTAFQELNIPEVSSSTFPVGVLCNDLNSLGRNPDLIISIQRQVSGLQCLSLTSPKSLTSPRSSPLTSPRKLKVCDVISEQENFNHD